MVKAKKMDLKSGYPYWAVRNGLMRTFPALDQDIVCDVAIIGGGITGALVADELSSNGYAVAVIEQRDIGWGSTAASTALLQYEIDTHLTELAALYGEVDALKAYRACAEAITDLQKIAETVSDVDFEMQESLYYASRNSDKKSLKDEFLLRQKHGFDVEWLESDAIKKRYGFKSPGAILSKLAARIDPYQLAHKLLDRLQNSGHHVYDRTEIKDLMPSDKQVDLTTTSGFKISCQHVVIATGYASQKLLKQNVASNRSSYAFITDPIAPELLAELNRTMMWESARPYLYMRTTGDGRLLVGGEDDAIDIPAKRDKRVDKKAHTLSKKVEKLFPKLPMNPTFSWAGTFAETEDGLPFFGAHPQYGERVQFAMAYGGNGITYSMIGAGLLRANIEQREHPLAELFSFSRLDQSNND
jgi:glycine/D-amino acid oxidase-like deaminating enzyme